MCIIRRDMPFLRPVCQRTAVYFIVLSLLVSAMAGGGGGGGDAVFEAPVGCPDHFRHTVKQCLEPYWSLAAILDSSGATGRVGVALAQHLCLQFELALVCLHTALTQCPGPANLHHVQSQLGSHWAVEIRNLCVGQSELSTNRVPGDGLGDPQQAVKPSSEHLHDTVAADEDNTFGDNNDNSGVVGNQVEEIIVLVPRQEDQDYQDIVVDVRNRVQFRPRHPYQHHKSSRERAPDVLVYNIFEARKDHYKMLASSARRVSELWCWTALGVVVSVVVGFRWS